MANHQKPGANVGFDALMPAEMAMKAENIGVRKAEQPFNKLLLLALLAGAFIGLGAEFFTIAITGTPDHVGYGLTKLIGGLAFCLGLILVVVAGAELFTGNALILMAYASKKVSTWQLLRNWGIVYVGNFFGSIFTAYFLFLSKQYTFEHGAIGATALNIANAKCSLDFWPALILGIYCNALVCLAVWLCFSARTTTDRILGIIFPVTAFVASGFEHCIANMYFIPLGLFIKSDPAVVVLAKSVTNLTWSNFLWRNLLPVTIGNIIGGAFMVGAIYWWIYLRPSVKVLKPAAAKVTGEQIPLGVRSVLLVDDDPDFCTILTTHFQNEGYDVRCAHSGEEGYQAVLEHRPDLVLLDIHMETESAGLDLAKRLRETPATRYLPIVLVSGATEPEAHAADRFLPKPVKFSLLQKTIDEVMENRGK
jgi:formate/nitrite transporter